MNDAVTIHNTNQPAPWYAGLIDPGAIQGAKALAASGLTPEAFANKPEKILVAGAMGARLGLDIFSALAGIAVINGRPTLWGDTQLAVCQQHSSWEDMIEEEKGEWPDTVMVCTVKRKGRQPYTARFGMADARQAKLDTKAGPWTQFPKRMCSMRARAFALRAAFADILSGFHTTEEMADVNEVIGEVVHTELPEPKAGKVRKTKADPASDAKPAEWAGADTTLTGIPPSGAGVTVEAPKQEPKPAEQAPPAIDPIHVPEQTTLAPAFTYQACRALVESIYKEGEPVRSVIKAEHTKMGIKTVTELSASDEARWKSYIQTMTAAAAAARVAVKA